MGRVGRDTHLSDEFFRCLRDRNEVNRNSLEQSIHRDTLCLLHAVEEALVFVRHVTVQVALPLCKALEEHTGARVTFDFHEVILGLFYRDFALDVENLCRHRQFLVDLHILERTQLNGNLRILLTRSYVESAFVYF